MDENDYKVETVSFAECNMGTNSYRLIWKSDIRPTLKEFCEHIAENKRGEWGYVRIVSKGCRMTFFDGKEVMSFGRGRHSENELFEKNANTIIDEVSASGGWSRMDWVVRLKEDVVE